MSDLNYKASNIAKAESALNANFFATIDSLGDSLPSFTAILMILMAGGLSEEEADELVDNEGIEAALDLAAAAIGKAGFLAKMKLAQSAMKSQSPKASQSSGETKKA